MFPLLGRDGASHENMALLSLKNLLKNQLYCWNHECVFVQWLPSAECTDADEHERRLDLLLTHCGPSKCDLSVESHLLNDNINFLK